MVVFATNHPLVLYFAACTQACPIARRHQRAHPAALTKHAAARIWLLNLSRGHNTSRLSYVLEHSIGVNQQEVQAWPPPQQPFFVRMPVREGGRAHALVGYVAYPLATLARAAEACSHAAQKCPTTAMVRASTHTHAHTAIMCHDTHAQTHLSHAKMEPGGATQKDALSQTNGPDALERFSLLFPGTCCKAKMLSQA